MVDENRNPRGEVVTRSTSRSTATADDIVLRLTTTTRLVFKPTLIEQNPHDPEASVNGRFIFQRKTPKGEWEPLSGRPLSSLKAGEMQKLELRAGELLHLVRSVSGLYELVRQQGIKLGSATWMKTPQSAVLRQLLENEDLLSSTVGESAADLIALVLGRLSHFSSEMVQHLSRLSGDELSNISAALGVARLTSFLETWRRNELNGDENFWQVTLRQNAWVISQVFAAPMVILRDQASLGGKSLTNTGGKIADVVFRNKIRSNVAIVEIKSPLADLVDTNSYRSGVYSVSKETIGGVTQLLTQKRTLIESLGNLKRAAEFQKGDDFDAFHPRALLITGSLRREPFEPAMVRSFELFRNELRDVEVVTFDELIQKVEDMAALLGLPVEESPQDGRF